MGTISSSPLSPFAVERIWDRILSASCLLYEQLSTQNIRLSVQRQCITSLICTMQTEFDPGIKLHVSHHDEKSISPYGTSYLSASLNESRDVNVQVTLYALGLS